MTSINRSLSARVAAGLMAGALVFAACGGSDAADDDTADTATSDTTTDGADEPDPNEPIVTSAPGEEPEPGSGVAILETGTVDYEAGTELPPYEGDDDPAVGMAAPVVEGQRFDGSAITLGGETEQPTMYVFLAHWCPHCNDEIPELLSLEADGELDDVEVVAVSTAVATDRENYPPSQWLDDKDWAWDAMADDEQSLAIIAYGGTSFPFVVLADTDGTVLSRKAGSSSASDIRAWLDESLANAAA